MVEVLVFGSSIMDFLCYVPRLPAPGETLHGHKFATGFGGKGANQCVAAARLGARTAMVTKLGDDTWGPQYMEHLRQEGVNVDFVQQCKGETTGIAQICVSDAGENHIVIVAGANNLLSADDVTIAQSLFNTAKILVCQLESPLPATLTALRTFSGTSILNAAPALADMPKELLQAASIFCVNETEAALTAGCAEIITLEQSKAALECLLQMGANTVIITLGALGAVYAAKKTPGECFHVPVQKVTKVVDTTGAGDAFIGALACYIARYGDQLPLHQLIGAACEVASHSVQFPGTQASYPNSSQLCNAEPNQRQFEWKQL